MGEENEYEHEMLMLFAVQRALRIGTLWAEQTVTGAVLKNVYNLSINTMVLMEYYCRSRIEKGDWYDEEEKVCWSKFAEKISAERCFRECHQMQ